MGIVGFVRAAAAGLLLAFCVACAAPGPAVGSAEGLAVSQASLSDYQLGPADHLRVTVFGEADLTGEFVVGPNGVVSYPLIGDVHAGGLTVAQFSQSLTESLRRYVRQPNVSVEVMNYRPFFILGEVSNPGTYPFAAGMTVMNAVATAGGFSYRADSRHVLIKHVNEIAEREYVLTSTTPVQPGDTVRVPERRF